MQLAELSPRRAARLGLALISLCLLLCVRPVQAGVAVETNDILQFDYQQTGANEEEAVRIACIRAVHATVGRLLMSDYSLQARDILFPYIEKNWNKFVASSYVLERRFERDGFGGRIRVQTFPEVLHRDLREKKFLYQPRPNPYHYVFVNHSINGQLAPVNLARRAAIDTILTEGGKAYESGVQAPPDNAYLLADPSLLSAGREAAARIGAEVIVTGYASTSLAGQEEIYYSPVFTFETTVHLDIIRVDDGTVFGSADATQRASDSDQNISRDESVQVATDAAMRDLLRRSRPVWRKTVLDQSKFSLMLTDVTPDQVGSIARHIEHELSHGSRARLKTYYGNVAIVTVDTERAYAALERAVQAYREADLRISDHQGKRITIDVKH